jgi:hypothetical protein
LSSLVELSSRGLEVTTIQYSEELKAKLIERAMRGAYHAFKFTKYAHCYLAEAQYRFNRRFNLRSIFDRLRRAACLTIPTPASVIRMAEVCR